MPAWTCLDLTGLDWTGLDWMPQAPYGCVGPIALRDSLESAPLVHQYLVQRLRLLIGVGEGSLESVIQVANALLFGRVT